MSIIDKDQCLQLMGTGKIISQAQEIGKSSSGLCEDMAVYAKTNNHSFLILDDCNLRLLSYRDLPQTRADSPPVLDIIHLLRFWVGA